MKSQEVKSLGRRIIFMTNGELNVSSDFFETVCYAAQTCVAKNRALLRFAYLLLLAASSGSRSPKPSFPISLIAPSRPSLGHNFEISKMPFSILSRYRGIRIERSPYVPIPPALISFRSRSLFFGNPELISLSRAHPPHRNFTFSKYYYVSRPDLSSLRPSR